jgi:hypothetical protein
MTGGNKSYSSSTDFKNSKERAVKKRAVKKSANRNAAPFTHHTFSQL